MDEYDYTTYAKQGRQLPCFCYKSVTSTNLTAKEMLRAGKVAYEFAVISREQTGGRGRYDRKFLSLAGKGMYVTYVARVPSDVDVSPLGGLCALCVTDLLYEVFEIQSLIKWPNDVLSGGRKICGILPECVYSADGGKYVLLGIGDNLFYTEQDFGDLRDIATSVALQCKNDILCAEFEKHKEHSIYRLGERLSVLCGELCRDFEVRGEEVVRRYKTKSFTIGKQVTFTDKDGRQKTGKAVDIDGKCALHVLCDDGEHTVGWGEVTVQC